MRLIVRLQQINGLLMRVVGLAIGLMVAAMASLIMLSVVARNLLNFSFQWIIDVNRLLFIWMCLLGVVYVSNDERLIRFDLLDKRFPPTLHNIVMLVRYAVSLVLFWIMTTAGMAVSRVAKPQMFSTIPVSTRWMYLAVATTGALLIFQTTMKFLALLPALWSKNQGKQWNAKGIKQ